MMADTIFQYRRIAVRVKMRDGSHDMEKLIKLKRMPADGLSELQEAVDKQGPKFIQYATDIQSGELELSSHLCNDFIGCVVAAVYTGGPQGRPHAIEVMTYKEFMRFWERNTTAFSSNFKTAKQFGAQVITIEEGLPKRLMQTYIEIIRPAVMASREERGIPTPTKGKLVR